MIFKIRIWRVLMASLLLSSGASAAIIYYQFEYNTHCIDDLSELADIALAETKQDGQVAVSFNQLYFDQQKQQWCYLGEMD